MNILLTLVLFGYVGAIFWSFATVLITRWHHKKSWILFGRSHCPTCNTSLQFVDLIPIVSYLKNGGKCRYCKNPIDRSYLYTEILMFAIFSGITYGIINANLGILWWSHICGLFLWFVTGVYIMYDINYMEIPDQILVPSIYMLLCILWLFPDIIFPNHTFHTFLIDKNITKNHLLWWLIIYTFFYLQILLPWGLYFIKKWQWKYLFELCISYFIFPITILIDFFFSPSKKYENKELGIPTWIGGGDLRIGIMIWLSLGTIYAIIALAIAYITWSIVGIIILIKSKNNQPAHHIPFWPFLWFWWLMCVIFFDELSTLIDLYLSAIGFQFF